MVKKYIANQLIIKDTEGNTKQEFDENGFMNVVRWRDEYPSSDWAFLTGATAPDVLTTNINGLLFRVWAFDGANTQEIMGNNFEIPHDIDLDKINNEDEFIEVHIHWLPSTSGNGSVKWFFDYVYLPYNSTPLSMNTLSCICPIDNEQYIHKIASFKDNESIIRFPKPSLGFNIGDLILFNIRRTPSDGDDTYSNDAYFLQCALHVPVNDMGSRERYVK